MPFRPVLLNTDIGNDPDDLLALCFLLMRPDIDLTGISTYGLDVHVRARLTRKVCGLAGRNIPVAAGAAHLLTRGGNPDWSPSGIGKSHTAEFILRNGTSALANVGEIVLMSGIFRHRLEKRDRDGRLPHRLRYSALGTSDFRD